MSQGIQAVALGLSAGGFEWLGRVLPALPALRVPLFLVVHRRHVYEEFLAGYLDAMGPLAAVEPDDKTPIAPGCLYVAPPGYHMLVESPGRRGRPLIALSVDPPVCFSRPSVDVLFETAAIAYGSGLLAFVGTGANGDGAAGLAAVVRAGGLATVQDPAEAEVSEMPRAGLRRVPDARVVTTEGLIELLQTLRSPEGA